MKVMSLKDYIIDSHLGNNAAFARKIKTSRQQVQGWISKGFFVVISEDGIDVQLCSVRRAL
jgi:hypothetical protein